MNARARESRFIESRYTALATDVEDRDESSMAVTGKLPPGLSGVLYRNGPGRFHRDGRSKRNLLDGDGVAQRLAIADGRARYSRRFVRTPKRAAEAEAGRFLRPTWTTRAPGWFANVGQRIQSQAGITVYGIDGKLLALDEIAPGFELDPDTLETLGPATIGLPSDDKDAKAHARWLPESGDWLFASTHFGARGMTIDLLRRRPDGTCVAIPTVTAPRAAYLHDFAATPNFAVVVLQAVRVHAFRFLAGLESFAECLEWRPDEGNIVMLVDLRDGTSRVFDAPACWVWHFANAYEQGRDVVVDFIGYDDPGHFLGPDAQLTAIMRGHEGVHGAPGALRRLVIDTATGRLRETRLGDDNHEFPTIDWRTGSREHRKIYTTRGAPDAGIVHSGIAAIDTHTGERDAYDFGPAFNALEPTFAPAPGGAIDEGWLIAQTLDTRAGTSAFAVFDARHVADGPLATIELGEAMPISFHGCWVPQ